MYWYIVRVCHKHGGQPVLLNRCLGLCGNGRVGTRSLVGMGIGMDAGEGTGCVSESVMKHVEIPLDEVWSQFNASTVDESGSWRLIFTYGVDRLLCGLLCGYLVIG